MVAGGTATFQVGTQTVGTAPLTSDGHGGLTATLSSVALLEPTPFGTAPTGQMNPGSRTVTAAFTGVDTNFAVNSATTLFTITQEDANIAFTAPMLVFTASPTTTSATVTLAATVQDTADGSRGDIRNARVTFFVNGAALTGSCAGLAPGLLNPLDTTTGTVSCTTTLSIPSSQNAQTFQIGVQVGGYYLRNAAIDDGMVTLALPTGSFLTGGGYLTMQSSAGVYQAAQGTKTNFGFDVKYNKAFTNLQGHVNIIYRAGSKIYQIKSTSLTSLGISTPNATLPVSSTNPATAVFVSKANLTDVTNSTSPISLGGGLSLQILLTDKGEPGSQDKIAITLMSGPQLWYSSNWTGTQTIEQLLSGGNLAAH